MNTVLPEEVLHDSVLLADFLQHQGVPEDATNVLKEEGVTGLTLPDVTECDLKEMHIKLGPRKRIMQIIKEVTCQTAIHAAPSFEHSFGEASGSTSSVIIQDVSILSGCENDIRLDMQNGTKLDFLNKSAEQHTLNQDSVDIRSWVSRHPQGKELCHNLDQGLYKTEDRQLLVRIVCSELVKLCGSAYPSSDLKEQVAEKIVSTFPGLRSKRFPYGHESFYDKSTGLGFLEYRFKTIRKSLSPCKKKRASQCSTKASKMLKLSYENDGLLTKDILEEKIIWMKLKNPTEPNRQAVSTALAETMPNRQAEIKGSSVTITDVLTKYPRLQDYKGDMIDAEFLRMYPNSDTFLGKFSSFYAPRILQYVETKRPDLLLSSLVDFSDALKALVLLPELLPSPNYGKGKGKKGQGKTNILPSRVAASKKIPSPALLRFVNGIEELDSTSLTSENNQPFLVGITSSSSCQYFIKADSLLISCDSHPMKAFDILFKLHFVFNVQYAHQLINFYSFLASCVYNISDPRACVDALNTCLSNIAVNI